MTTPWPGEDPVPSYGYQVPYQPGWYDPALDPLVPQPGTRLEAWTERITGTLRRSWLPVGLILLVLVAAPNILFGILGAGLGAAVEFAPETSAEAFRRPEFAIGTIGVLLLLGLITIILNALAWASSIWAITQGAVGQPAPLGDAIRAGARRMWPMLGWYILYGLMCGVGLVFCLLPGLYLALAGSLFSFVVMYERGTGPIGRSFSIVHREFGAALGRVLLLALVYLGVSVLVSDAVGGGALGAGAIDFSAAESGSSPVSIGFQVVGQIVSAAVAIPLELLLIVGLLVTYTQLRARHEPVSTVQLHAAVNA